MRVKLLTGLTAAIMALTPINAFAASDFSLGNGQLEYKGTISGGAGKEITLTVLKPGYVWDEATWSNGDSNAIAYWDSTTIDSSGNYSFKLNLSESGVYNVIYTVGGDKVNGADTIENIIKTETEKVTEDVVAMTTTDDIEVKIKESYADMGISSDNLDKKAGDISKIILNSKELLDKDDAEKSVAVYKKADAAAELNNGLITDIAGREGDLGIIDSDYEKWYNVSFSTKVALRLSNKNFENVKTFDEAVCEAVLLERIANPDGNSDVMGIVKDFYDEIGLASGSVSNYAASKIAGNSYSSFNALKIAIESIKESGGGSSGGSSGGSNLRYPTNVSDGEDKNSETYCRFEDMQGFEWAAQAVETLARKGVINGVGDGRFEPASFITREEFAKMIVSMLNINVVPKEFKFEDVSKDAWYYEYVRRAYASGVANGTSETTFGSGDNILRQDAIVMAYNGLSYAEKLPNGDIQRTFGDGEEVSDYAVEKVSHFAKCGFVSGDENGNVNPRAFITRAEAAQLIYNIISRVEI